jgi:hypothetical protein
MTDKLFFLVEYGTDYHIERRHLFETSEEAKNFCKKELHLKYNRKNGFWQGENRFAGAKIITLTLEKTNDR